MRVKIAKWGNSTAVRIPQAIVDGLKLKVGEDLDARLKGGLLELARPGTLPSLDELYRLAETQEVPELLEWGPDRGLERLDPEADNDFLTLRNSRDPHPNAA